VRETIRLKHYSIRTEEAYVNWVRRFILFHDKRHPLDIGGKEVEAFLTPLTKEETQRVPAQLSGIHRLQAKLLYGGLSAARWIEAGGGRGQLPSPAARLRTRRARRVTHLLGWPFSSKSAQVLPR
jgi:Phage integrase, N-terminal SAM-like domain